MKYLLIALFVLTSFPYTATADEAYDEFARDLQKMRDTLEQEDQEWYERKKKEDPFAVAPIPSEDKIKTYSDDHTTIELNNNMSPYGKNKSSGKSKSSENVLRGLFKSVDD